MNIKELKICVVIPTYNNDKTLSTVIDGVSQYVDDIMIVNDGSTDRTNDVIAGYNGKITVISYTKNRGKGYAIREAMTMASLMDYRYMITIDADGQHFPSDIIAIIDKIKEMPDSLIIGSRIFTSENIPNGNIFANRFSNFWFRVQTGYNLQDTQTGFRLYPLNRMKKIRNITNRYESELELLVRSAWSGIKLIPVPISVYYPSSEDRVSHFRPFKDFFRISLLNTALVITAFIYGYPSMLIHKFFNR